MSAIQVAPSGERSQGRGRYGVVCRGNPVDPYLGALGWSFIKGAMQVRLPVPFYLYTFLWLKAKSLWAMTYRPHHVENDYVRALWQ